MLSTDESAGTNILLRLKITLNQGFVKGRLVPACLFDDGHGVEIDQHDQGGQRRVLVLVKLRFPIGQHGKRAIELIQPFAGILWRGGVSVDVLKYYLNDFKALRVKCLVQGLQFGLLFNARSAPGRTAGKQHQLVVGILTYVCAQKEVFTIGGQQFGLVTMEPSSEP